MREAKHSITTLMNEIVFFYLFHVSHITQKLNVEQSKFKITSLESNGSLSCENENCFSAVQFHLSLGSLHSRRGDTASGNF